MLLFIFSGNVTERDTLHGWPVGSLGLDPPTMKLCSGGASAEMEQALENCEAVARSFKCSLASSTILFVVYCSAALTSSQKIVVQSKLDAFLEQRSDSDFDNSLCKSFDPMVLYILALNLPKSALVEVKPTLYVQEDDEMECGNVTGDSSCITSPSYWGFQHIASIGSCFQKYVINKKICAVTLSINEEHASNICCKSLVAMHDHGDFQYFESQKRIKQITRFCIYLIDRILLESYFSWGDITVSFCPSQISSLFLSAKVFIQLDYVIG
ncbi:hypothetical protein IFM89_017759 [Coptis chinensis]|uniref:Uncharacterized protein n=1 Tax=Coptis chinensis TaxID=261450 RepID=A0A835HZ55_9MAGN|nr:hypothetical protein IFM89_017759 [Coptis chinensis]